MDRPDAASCIARRGKDASRIRSNPGIFARLRGFAFNILKANRLGTLARDLPCRTRRARAPPQTTGVEQPCLARLPRVARRVKGPD
jgi:hypothetical protein